MTSSINIWVSAMRARSDRFAAAMIRPETPDRTTLP